MKPRMSFFVTRPPRPVPGTWPTSMLCSAAIRATTGETNAFSPSTEGAAGAAAGVSVTGAGATSGAASGASGGAASASGSGAASGGASAGAAAEPSGPITARTVPTSTVSPSCTRIFWSTPLAGLGTSVSTLSVEISSSDSSAAIASPGCFSHFVIVPSLTETPIWGITTSTAV